MRSVADWPTTAQVARQLGVTPDRVRQLAKDGRLDSVRTGLGRLLDPASVERLVAERAERRAVVA
jgi:excisionase family DNA binding protein